MKVISIIQAQNKTSFGTKYNPERLERIGYADAYTEKYMDYLREHILSQALPPKELYGGRMSEFELNSFLEKLFPPIVKNKNLPEADLGKLKSYNISKIEGMQNSYRGPREYSDIKILEQLKLKLVFADNVVDDVIWDMDTNKLVKFIKTMQSDNIYIGCMFGTDRTDEALLINQYFNPLSKDTNKYHINGIGTLGVFEDICNNLTLEQKKEMCWTQEFETKLRKKIKENIEYYIKS